MNLKRTFGSLRGRVAVVATTAVAAVLLLVGAGALASFADREQERIDESLVARPAPELARALREAGDLPGAPQRPGGEGRPGSRFGPPVLRPQGEYVRLINDGEVELELDVPDGLPVPEEPGVRTLSTDGTEYRSLSREIAPGVLIEAGVDTSESQQRVAELRDRLFLIGLAGVLLVAGLSWWLAGLALRPLARLREAAGTVSTTDDLSRRIDPGASPAEVEELTESINAMLERLQASSAETSEALEATRRFAADAGHELRTPMTSLRANLDLLLRNPGMEPTELEAALAQMDREAARMVRMLGTLQALARGDSAAALPRERIDLSAVVGGAVESARRRHPGITWRFEAADGEVEVDGWSDGLTALADNLLENAARHGRKDGKVDVSVDVDGPEATLIVDDDGPGIPASSREQAFERFRRGDVSGAEGSGLGLSLVRQQARLHGGDAAAGESPAGGARFRVRLRAGSARPGDRSHSTPDPQAPAH